jgi:Bacterial capsule synthesis protein PGA_cap
MRRALARLTIWFLVACFGSTAGVRAAGPLLFRGACTANNPQADRIVIAGVGDLLFHEVLQRQALTPETNYTSYFASVAPVLTGADITYGNLEGPAAHGVVQGGREAKDPGRVYDGKVYGTAKDALIFNYHPSVVADLKAVGFSIVSTANNHAADRRALGIDRTIDALDAVGLSYTGTRRRTLLADGRLGGSLTGSWSTITEARGPNVSGMRVAWLACTFCTNSMPDPQAQVLLCYQQRDTVMAELKRLANDPSISAVILTPHWGDEGAARPKLSDRVYARAAIEAGAAAVIGTHPHVLQPWEHVTTSDGREGLVIYSTGNFLSNQHTTAQRSGVISLLELTRLPGHSKARLTAAGFVPTWVEKHNEAGHRIVEMTDGGWYVGEPAPGAKIKPLTRRLGKGGPKTANADAVVVDGLATTLKLLPDNRVAMANFRAPPRGNCPPVEAPAAPEPVPDVMVVADPGAPTAASMIVMPSRTLTLARVAGAISVVVAVLPQLPVPPPRGRTDPVLRTRRAERLRDAANFDLVGLNSAASRQPDRPLRDVGKSAVPAATGRVCDVAQVEGPEPLSAYPAQPRRPPRSTSKRRRSRRRH